MTNGTIEKSSLFYARLAGFGLLLMAVLAIFSNFFVIESLIIPGDGAKTTSNIMANEMLFRSGIASFILVLILDVLVAWALYHFLKPVNKNLALLAAWFRLIYTAIFGVALSNFISVLPLLNGAAYLKAFEMDQVHALLMLSINAFNTGWLIGLVFFALHLVLVGYLIIKSVFIPRILGILLILASLGYLIDNFAKILLPNYAEYETIFLLIVALPGVIGELSFAIWLLFKGNKIRS